MLGLLARVERATGSGRSIPLFADMIRGLASDGAPWSTIQPNGRSEFDKAAPWPRFWAILTACDLPPHPQIVAALTETLDDDTTPSSESAIKTSPPALKHIAAWTLLHLQDPVGLEAYLEAWLSTSEQVWPLGYVGFGAFYWLPLTEDMAPFRRELYGPWDVWCELGRETDTDPVKEYIEQLDGDPCSMNNHIAYALARTGDGRLVRPMLRRWSQCKAAKRDRGFGVLKNLVERQIEKGEAADLGALIDGLSDPNEDVRAGVAILLGEHGYSAALPEIRRLLLDPSRRVKKAARRAARQLEASQK